MHPLWIAADATHRCARLLIRDDRLIGAVLHLLGTLILKLGAHECFDAGIDDRALIEAADRNDRFGIRYGQRPIEGRATDSRNQGRFAIVPTQRHSCIAVSTDSMPDEPVLPAVWPERLPREMSLGGGSSA